MERAHTSKLKGISVFYREVSATDDRRRPGFNSVWEQMKADIKSAPRRGADVAIEGPMRLRGTNII